MTLLDPDVARFGFERYSNLIESFGNVDTVHNYVSFWLERGAGFDHFFNYVPSLSGINEVGE